MKQNYPYITDKKLVDTPTQRKILKYLTKIFRPLVRDQLTTSNHTTPQQMVAYIDKMRAKYPYYLKFDFEKFYVNIRHDKLIDTIYALCHLRDYIPKKTGIYYINKIKDEYLSSSPFTNMNIPTGSTLSCILSNIYLYPLDSKICHPFTRYVDDVIVLFDDPRQIDIFVEQVLLPICHDLGLTLHPQKIQSGRWSKSAVSYLGFKFIRGIISICGTSVQKFIAQIVQITSRVHNDSVDKLIEKLNHRIDGFGHYYKIARVSRVFDRLDKMIRHRIRRYASSEPGADSTTHFVWTNAQLDKSGLHRLTSILTKTPQNRYKRDKPVQTNTSSIKEDLRRIEQKLDVLMGFFDR